MVFLKVHRQDEKLQDKTQSKVHNSVVSVSVMPKYNYTRRNRKNVDILKRRKIICVVKHIPTHSLEKTLSFGCWHNFVSFCSLPPYRRHTVAAYSITCLAQKNPYQSGMLPSGFLLDSVNAICQSDKENTNCHQKPE